MKKTIKEDKQRKVLNDMFLDDNALLEITMENNSDVVVGLRFVESSLSGIKEHILAKMSIYDFLSDYHNLVKIADDCSAVAIFKKIEEEFQLDRVYDTKKHEFALGEFIDIVYEEKFPKLALDKHLVLKTTD